jgi:hypothetical protein
MTDKIYLLLKKRFDELVGAFIAVKKEERILGLNDIWLNYLEGVGCAVIDHVRPPSTPLSESENFVICRNPSSPPFGKGSVEEVWIPKKTALKALVVGDFPPASKQK